MVRFGGRRGGGFRPDPELLARDRFLREELVPRFFVADGGGCQ